MLQSEVDDLRNENQDLKSNLNTMSRTLENTEAQLQEMTE